MRLCGGFMSFSSSLLPAHLFNSQRHSVPKLKLQPPRKQQRENSQRNGRVRLHPSNVVLYFLGSRCEVLRCDRILRTCPHQIFPDQNPTLVGKVIEAIPLVDTPTPVSDHVLMRCLQRHEQLVQTRGPDDVATNSLSRRVVPTMSRDTRLSNASAGIQFEPFTGTGTPFTLK